jgi:hypothetical protein
MLAGMTTTRQHLLAWVHAHGLAALDELFREEAVALAGHKGRHQSQRTHHHWGTAATELTFGAGACRYAGKSMLHLSVAWLASLGRDHVERVGPLPAPRATVDRPQTILALALGRLLSRP